MLNMLRFTLCLLGTLFLAPIIAAYSTGAPVGAISTLCQTMRPNHGVNGSIDPVPYSISLGSVTSYILGSSVTGINR